MKKEYIIYKLSEEMKSCTKIDNELFQKYDVKRGLRNEDGTGVLVGLTKIGNVVGYERIPGGGLQPIPGKLFYRGYDVEDLVHSTIKEKRFGFEEVAFLLLSGRLPDKEELAGFLELLNDNMPLEQKTKMNILELEGSDIMNILARSVLELYTFDPKPDDNSRDNLMRQSIELISKFPTIIAYAYNMLRHATFGRSLHIRHPQENLSIAENFLFMLKKDYTELEARTLDLLLVLQAEHGGGNNSTFTVRVTSSTGTDTYSAISASIGSLKGLKHGGANEKVKEMVDHLKNNIDVKNNKLFKEYLMKIINKEVFDQADNNEVYKKYVDEYYRTLAMGIYNLQYAYDPSMIIIGGAISSRSDLLDKVNEQLDIIFSQLTHAHVRPNIKVCQFGNDANLIGATYHYIQRH